MVEHGQITGSKQKIVLFGFSFWSRLTRLISVPTAHFDPDGASVTFLMMYSVDPLRSDAFTTSSVHSGCTITWIPGCSFLAVSTCSTVNRPCTERWTFHSRLRDARSFSGACPLSGASGFLIAVS